LTTRTSPMRPTARASGTSAARNPPPDSQDTP
jgi:hypothetical protein